MTKKISREVKENRERWIKALESGEFRQTKGQLKKRNRYCCLGVWCEISTWEYAIDEAGDYETELNKDGRRALGMSADQMTEAIDLNDDGMKFKEIAAYFRKTWRMVKINGK